MIELTNAKKTYPDFELDLSLEVPENTITALVGPNGAGKSTAFKLMMNLAEKSGGSVRVLGEEAEKLSIKKKERLGIVMQSLNYNSLLSIKNMEAVEAAFYPKFDEQKFKDLLIKTSMKEDMQLSALSTGQTALLKVITALSHDPDLLLLDEPTAGLDAIVREDVLALLRQFMEKDGKSILISSHIASDLESLCDNFIFINKGKKILEDTIDNLMSDYGILKVSQSKFDKLDKSHLIKKRKREYGYDVLAKHRAYYGENYPDIEIEPASLDQMELIMVKGEDL